MNWRQLEMSKNLYCPECSIEYWGESKNPKCDHCDYLFTERDVLEATSLDSLIQHLIKREATK